MDLRRRPNHRPHRLHPDRVRQLVHPGLHHESLLVVNVRNYVSNSRQNKFCRKEGIANLSKLAREGIFNSCESFDSYARKRSKNELQSRGIKNSSSHSNQVLVIPEDKIHTAVSAGLRPRIEGCNPANSTDTTTTNTPKDKL